MQKRNGKKRKCGETRKRCLDEGRIRKSGWGGEKSERGEKVKEKGKKRVG